MSINKEKSPEIPVDMGLERVADLSSQGEIIGDAIIQEETTSEISDSCLILLKEFYLCVPQSAGTKEDRAMIQESLIKLQLWRDGFKVGELEEILARSRKLRMAVLQHLSEVAKASYKGVFAFSNSTLNDETYMQLAKMSTLLDKLVTLTKPDHNESGEESDDEFPSLPHHPHSYRHRIMEDIPRHVNLLMNLLPSLYHFLEYLRNEKKDEPVTERSFTTSEADVSNISTVRGEIPPAEHDIIERREVIQELDSNTLTSKSNQHNLFQNPELEMLQVAAQDGDIATASRIIEVKPNIDDPKTLYNAAKGGHDTVINLLFALGNFNPDPEAVDGAPADQPTPILAAIGKGYLEVIQLFLANSKFNPSKRFKGESYYEIARRIAGPKWQEEEELLRTAAEAYQTRGLSRRSSLNIAKIIQRNKKEASAEPKIWPGCLRDGFFWCDCTPRRKAVKKAIGPTLHMPPTLSIPRYDRGVPRQYWICPELSSVERCDFFIWVDEETEARGWLAKHRPQDAGEIGSNKPVNDMEVPSNKAGDRETKGRSTELAEARKECIELGKRRRILEAAFDSSDRVDAQGLSQGSTLDLATRILDILRSEHIDIKGSTELQIRHEIDHELAAVRLAKNESLNALSKLYTDLGKLEMRISDIKRDDRRKQHQNTPEKLKSLSTSHAEQSIRHHPAAGPDSLSFFITREAS